MKPWLATMIAYALNTACASKGTFVPINAYTTASIAYGTGRSQIDAHDNAVRSVPNAYVAEFSPYNGCEDPNEVPLWDKDKQTRTCLSGKYYSVVPVLPKDPAQRQRETFYRKSKYGAEYIGVGSTLVEAMGDILAKLPKESVVDNYIVACTKEISIDSKTGTTFCDSGVEGNDYEIRTRVLKPNAESFIRTPRVE